jgi:predicted RNA-binding protein Jag
VSAEERSLQEAQAAVEHVVQTSEPVDLAPQPSHLRRLQHQLAGQYDLRSESTGVEPKRRVRISK